MVEIHPFYSSFPDKPISPHQAVIRIFFKNIYNEALFYLYYTLIFTYMSAIAG